MIVRRCDVRYHRRDLKPIVRRQIQFKVTLVTGAAHVVGHKTSQRAPRHQSGRVVQWYLVGVHRRTSRRRQRRRNPANRATHSTFLLHNLNIKPRTKPRIPRRRLRSGCIYSGLYSLPHLGENLQHSLSMQARWVAMFSRRCIRAARAGRPTRAARART